jgi:hypothetical protein
VLGRHGDGDRRRRAGQREADPATPGTAAAGERGETEIGARGTDSSTHLGQGRHGEGDRRQRRERGRRRQTEKLPWGNFMDSATGMRGGRATGRRGGAGGE